MTETASRQRLLEVLCGDLDAQGWDQNHKAWLVRGTPEDEYLEFVSEFGGEPEGYFAIMAIDNPVPDDVVGLVLMTEGWSYPPELRLSFKSQEALAAYWRFVPPQQHPERIETRHLVLTCTDGSIAGMLDYHKEDVRPEWSFMTIDKNLSTGNPTLDIMRAVLGINEPLLGTLRAVNDGVVRPLEGMMETIKAGQEEGWDQAKMSYELLKGLPYQVRLETIATMPQELRDAVYSMPEEMRRELGI